MTAGIVRIAVQGCGHGELDNIYAEVVRRERENGEKIDLLLICGDFQAIRNEVDLKWLACPEKYKRLGDFHEYYSGIKKAPVLTLVIGGNHESSAYMWELFHGGWLAENIYFLGYAGVCRFKGLTIGGLSGIYKENDYLIGHHEKYPLSWSNIHTVYHCRKIDVQKMLLLRENNLDIVISHDWPRGIWDHGDLSGLLKRKPYLEKDISSYILANPGARDILYNLKPAQWFAAHHHIRFEATIRHNERRTTHFVALDKCGKNRKHFDVFAFKSENVEQRLEYDPHWLAILRLTNDYMNFTIEKLTLPPSACDEVCSNLQWIRENIDDFAIKPMFQTTAPTHRQVRFSLEARNAAGMITNAVLIKALCYRNPQTVALAALIGVADRINIDGNPPYVEDHQSLVEPEKVHNEDEIVIDDDF